MKFKVPYRELDPNSFFKKTKKYFKNNVGIFVCLTLFIFFLIYFIVLKIIETNPSASKWHSDNISKYYILGIGKLTSFLPFSLMEFFILSLVIFGIILIVLMIKNFSKKKLNKGLLKLSILAVLIMGTVSTYEFAVGPSYHKATYQVQLLDNEKKEYDYKEVVTYLIEDFNASIEKLEFEESGQVKNKYTLKELGEIMDKEYKKLNSDYLFEFTPTPKYLLSSFVFRECQITGVYFGMTGESHLTKGMPNGEIPFTLAHELAHAKGDMDEYDCNTLALQICLNSDNPYLKYSAYYYELYDAINLLNYMPLEKDQITETKNKLIGMINSKYFADSKYSQSYWKSHKFFKDLADKINDAYLKTFGKKSGSSSYIIDDEQVEKEKTKTNPSEIIYTKIQKVFLNRYNNNAK